MEMLKNLLPVVGILFIIMSLYSFSRRRQKQGPAVSARDQLEGLKERKRLRDDLGTLMLEVEELTRRFSAQIDAKTLRLERMIQEAEIRIDQLQRLEKQLGQPPANLSLAETDQEATGVQASAATASESGPSASGETPMQTLTRSVHELADDGLDARQIAEKLDEHLGKIELILNLRTTASR
ncbi:hypothetical protein [Mucisphaera sp.]|uniref:hypothetical protein n=1 Tax=Mucisphaera sp. TaxID=2913024 RepID=UPI003D132A94